MKPLKAWACVGSHGKIFGTLESPHAACIGRLQVYLTKQDAERNDHRVVQVEIREVPPKGYNPDCADCRRERKAKP